MKFLQSASLFVILAAVFLISSCGSSENATEEVVEDNRNLMSEYDDINFYIPPSNIEEFELPDGSAMPVVLIPGGSFLMGLDNADPFGIQPAGKVRISVNSFMLGQKEVTNRQYRSFLDSVDGGERAALMPDSTSWEREVGLPWSSYFWAENFADYPVVSVTWEQARAFAEWAGGRLPAESEWEYAARSGVSGRIFPWEGLDIRHPKDGSLLANFAPGGDYGQDGYVITSPVGAFRPNNFRLYDMAGNVAEWTEDAYAPSYSALTSSGSQLVTPIYRSEREDRRIVRGGSWASTDFFIGVGVRDFRRKDHASPRIGFRIARSVSNPQLLMNQINVDESN